MMLLFFVVLFFISVCGVHFVQQNSEYMNMATTISVKGTFIALVMLSHAKSYVSVDTSGLNGVYVFLIGMIRQLMVAMFLFYSGYGVFEGYKNKPQYEKCFIKRHVVKMLVHFDIAVAFYAILNLSLHIPHRPIEWLLWWIGWESIGNSNWFIFVILICYGIAWFSLLIAKSFKGRTSQACSLALIGCCITAYCLFAAGKQAYWYDTILCFPCGMLFSQYRKRIEKLLVSGWGYYLP